MHQYLFILWTKLRSAFQTLLSGRKGGTVKNISSVIVYAGFTFSTYVFTLFIMHYMLDVLKIGLYLFHQYLSMALFVFFLTISLGNMIVSYATLYRSKEVGFLMTQPVSHMTVFLLKFFDNFFYSSSTLILVGGAALFGYGSYFGYTWHMYLVVIAGVVLPFTVMAGCIGVLLLMGLLLATRYVRPRQLVVILVGLYLLAVVVYFRSNNPFLLANEVMKYYPHIDEYFRNAKVTTVAVLPNQWAAEIFYCFAYRSPMEAVPPFLLLLGTGGLLFAGMLAAARKYYYASWILSLDFRMRESGKLSRLVTFFRFTSKSHWKPQTEVVLKKDYWTFFREPSQWFHLAILVFLTLVFIFGVSGARYRAGNPVLQTVAYITIYLFNGFLISSMALRFAFPAISLEGEMLWTLRSAPMTMKKLLRLKYRMWTVCVLAFAVPLAYLTMYPWRKFAVLLWFAIGSAMVLSAGFVGLNLGLGGFFADFREKNPVRIASSQGASISFLLCLALLAFVVTIAVLPIRAYYTRLILGTPLPSVPLWGGAAVITVLTAVIALLALRAGGKALRRDV